MSRSSGPRAPVSASSASTVINDAAAYRERPHRARRQFHLQGWVESSALGCRWVGHVERIHLAPNLQLGQCVVRRRSNSS